MALTAGTARRRDCETTGRLLSGWRQTPHLLPPSGEALRPLLNSIRQGASVRSRCPSRPAPLRGFGATETRPNLRPRAVPTAGLCGRLDAWPRAGGRSSPPTPARCGAATVPGPNRRPCAGRNAPPNLCASPRPASGPWATRRGTPDLNRRPTPSRGGRATSRRGRPAERKAPGPTPAQPGPSRRILLAPQGLDLLCFLVPGLAKLADEGILAEIKH